MAVNLSRNTKMYVSTANYIPGTSDATIFTSTNTWEVPVLDGYSFSQGVESQEITLNESGCTPVRGQKSFNTALNPVELSFPTYMKPYRASGTETFMVEHILWDAFVGGTAGYVTQGTTKSVIDFNGSDTNGLLQLTLIFKLDTTAYIVTGVTVGSVEVDFAIDQIAMLNWSGQGSKITEDNSVISMVGEASASATPGTYLQEPSGTAAPQFIKNKLSQISIYEYTKTAFSGYQTVDYGRLLVGSDNITTTLATYSFYLDIDDSGTPTQVDVNLVGDVTVSDVITSINAGILAAFTTQDASASLTSNGNIIITSATAAGVGSTIDITQGNITDANYLWLQLATATATFKDVLPPQDGLDVGTVYNIPITGGSLTLENNITFLTPEELGKVNQPLAGGFSGARAFSGTLNAYLNTGATRSGGLLDKLTGSSYLNSVSNRFHVEISVGGTCTGNSTHVDFIMPYAQLTIPTISVEDVISTEIGFTAQGSDITQPDELTIEYYANLT